MPRNTSLASASCGTHFGLTKLVASIVRRPVAERRSINAILSAVAMTLFSFCSPSRGPTSTIRTLAGMATSRLQGHQHRVCLDEVARRGTHFGNDAIARRLQRELHLHRLDHHQLLARLHTVAGLRLDD